MNWSLREVDQEYHQANRSWLPWYMENYQTLRQLHPDFQKGWFADALTPHRFIPRLFWWMMQDDYWKGSTIMDFGSYDGTLVKALRTSGHLAFGAETRPWRDMWNGLGIGEYMNPVPHSVRVAVGFNYAHSRTPQEFVDYVCESLNMMPEFIMADREPRTPNKNNRLWFDRDLLEAAGFYSFSFPQIACLGEETKRDLLIRKHK